MEGIFKDRILKEVENITYNVTLIRSLQKDKFSESLTMLSQAWNGDSADRFIVKSNSLCENLDGITGSLEQTVEHLMEIINKE